jgi:hypothetical protein
VQLLTHALNGNGYWLGISQPRLCRSCLELPTGKVAVLNERLSPVRKSTGRPDVGLLQIQGSWATVTRAVCKKQDVIKALLNAKCNVKVAGYLYRNGGLGHWRATSGK